MSLSGVMKMTQKYAKFGGFAADTHPRPASHSFGHRKTPSKTGFFSSLLVPKLVRSEAVNRLVGAMIGLPTAKTI
jgi:hypothetical protein